MVLLKLQQENILIGSETNTFSCTSYFTKDNKIFVPHLPTPNSIARIYVFLLQFFYSVYISTGSSLTIGQLSGGAGARGRRAKFLPRLNPSVLER